MYFHIPAVRRSFRFKGGKGLAARMQGYGSQFRPWSSTKGKDGNSLECLFSSPLSTEAHEFSRPLETSRGLTPGPFELVVLRDGPPGMFLAFPIQNQSFGKTVLTPTAELSMEPKVNPVTLHFPQVVTAQKMTSSLARGLQEPNFAADGKSTVQPGVGLSADNEHQGAVRVAWGLFPTLSKGS